MKILVTGSKGFVGKNLIVELKNQGYSDIFEYDIDTNADLLDKFCADAEFVFHLAGVNRPKQETEFVEGNSEFTAELLNKLKKYGNKCPVMISSSIQAKADNAYGKSKKVAEEIVFKYSEETAVNVFVYRFPNIFGKWCRPNYNSVVATFCNNVARDIPIQINDKESIVNLVYIDDVVRELIRILDGNAEKKDGFCVVPVEYFVKVGDIADLIFSFKNSRENLLIPDMSDDFTKKLYSTYLSYLPKDCFNYSPDAISDNRGSFTEIIKTAERGQISINVIKPGITKGNHWHHTKNEKFVVVSGTGIIRFRDINLDEIIEYKVNGDNLEIVDIPPGYTHNIENTGNIDMVTLMWANEVFDKDNPDTYYMEV